MKGNYRGVTYMQDPVLGEKRECGLLAEEKQKTAPGKLFDEFAAKKCNQKAEDHPVWNGGQPKNPPRPGKKNQGTGPLGHFCGCRVSSTWGREESWLVDEGAARRRTLLHVKTDWSGIQGPEGRPVNRVERRP